MLYVGAPDGKFLALDAKTGVTKWTFDLSPASGVRDGAAVAGDKVYFGDSTGRVYALYKATGKLAWVTQVEDHPMTLMISSPTVFDGDVYIGVSTGEGGATRDPNYPCCTHRGSVVSLDANTGSVNWQFYTMPEPKEVGTWPSGAKKYAPSGGSVWATPVIDPRTGATANLVTVAGRTLVVAGQKDSRLHAFDARSGRIAWQTPLVPVGPGGVGVEWGTTYDGKWIYAATWGAPSKLVAVDPATGKIAWRADHPANGCTTGGAAQFPELCALSFTPAVSATPGLLYEGSMDGKMRIFSSANGAVLWEFDAIRDFDGVNGVPGRGSAISG